MGVVWNRRPSLKRLDFLFGLKDGQFQDSVSQIRYLDVNDVNPACHTPGVFIKQVPVFIGARVVINAFDQLTTQCVDPDDTFLLRQVAEGHIGPRCIGLISVIAKVGIGEYLDEIEGVFVVGDSFHISAPVKGIYCGIYGVHKM